jgi:hypothetical protein
MTNMKDTLTREQALLRVRDHLGEEVYVGLEVHSGGGGSEVIGLHGKLRQPYKDVRDTFGSVYTVGGQDVRLASLPGTITETANGLNFGLTAGIALRIGWNAHERRDSGSRVGLSPRSVRVLRRSSEA